MPGPFCLVVNPAAGAGRSRRLLPPAIAALAAAGATYQVAESASLRHAEELGAAALRRGDVLVAVGGDGLAGALAGLTAAGAGTYGIIPAGRGNDLARVLGIPADPAAAAGVLVSGAARRVDLIGVSVPGQPDRIVVGSVYIGIPAVAGEIANATRWLTGPMVYPLAALRALAAWQPASFQVEIIGARQPATPAAAGAGPQSIAGYAVVVANSAYFGAGMKVAPPARIDDGMLDIVLMRRGSKLAFVRALAKIKNGSHVSLPQISLHRGTEVTVTVDRAMSAAADGEPLPGAAPLPAATRLAIRVLPAALTVLAPAADRAT